jgi:hypothetical protein
VDELPLTGPAGPQKREASSTDASNLNRILSVWRAFIQSDKEIHCIIDRGGELTPGGGIRLPRIRPNRSNRPGHRARRPMVAPVRLRRDLIPQDRVVALESLNGSHDPGSLLLTPGMTEDLLTEGGTRRGPAGWMERE